MGIAYYLVLKTEKTIDNRNKHSMGGAEDTTVLLPNNSSSITQITEVRNTSHLLKGPEYSTTTVNMNGVFQMRS